MRIVKIIVNSPNVSVFVDNSNKKSPKALTEELMVGFIQKKLAENLETWVKEFDKSLQEQLNKVNELENKKVDTTDATTKPNPNVK